MATLTLTYEIDENDPKIALAELLKELAGGLQELTFEHTNTAGQTVMVDIADVVDAGLF